MPEVILLGLTSQGLSMLRMLSRQQWQVLAFTESTHQVGYYSKYGEKRLFADIHDLKCQLKNIALKRAEQYPGRKLLCIIASGVILADILREYPEIYQDFTVEPSPIEWVQRMCHKDQMYQYGIDKGFSCAKFCLLSELKPGFLSFPLVVKRNYEVHWQHKMKIIPDQESLEKLFTETDPLLYPDLIQQEYIHTESPMEISCQTYSRNGKILTMLVVHQRNKLKKGLTAALDEITDPDIFEKIQKQSVRFMEGSQYTGFSEIEYLYDEANGSIHLMEINTRPCGWHSAMVHKFPDLAKIYEAEEPTSISRISNRLFWMNIVRDIRSRIERKDFTDLFHIFRCKFDILDIRDLKPFFSQVLLCFRKKS